MLACAGALNYADRTAISSVFPLLAEEFHLSDIQLASIGSLFLWSYAACSPVAGLIADRVARGPMVALSLLAWSLVTIWTGLARSTTELLLTRVLLGAAECAYLPAAVGLIGSHHGAETRGRALGIHVAGLNIGLVGGSALAGYLGEAYGWRAGIWLLGAIGILVAAAAWFVLPKDRPERALAGGARLAEQLKGLVSNPVYRLLAIEGMLLSVGTWMFFNWMPLYFREAFGLSLAIAGFSGTGALQISAVTGMLIGGVLSDRAARRSPASRYRIMFVAYLLCAPALMVFLTGASMAAITAMVIYFSFVRAIGSSNETPALCDLLPPQDRSTAQGLLNMLNTTAGGIGVLLAGTLKADWGLGGVFAGVAGLVVLAAGASFAAWRLSQSRAT